MAHRVVGLQSLMSDAVDTVVVGAGVVGLAIARALALSGREVVVLEKNRGIGEETSSRNSEVIHAGLYYAPGSLKANLCVAGKKRLYDYCAAKNIAHRLCGKLIVAIHPEQIPRLEALRETARANGVDDLEWLEARAVNELEPAVLASAALRSPSTGIVDSHALLLALRGDLEQAGGFIALSSRLVRGRREHGRFALTVEVDGESTELAATVVINAAGLHASAVARALHGSAPGEVPETLYAKGNYFIYSGKSPFRQLVYPLPENGGLGIHATLDLGGRTRFGPDVEWLQERDTAVLDYRVDPRRAAAFERAIRAYWPALPDGALEPGYAGIRPKLAGPGASPADFAIACDRDVSGAAAVHLFGIESPGLTASLAIAEHVRALLG